MAFAVRPRAPHGIEVLVNFGVYAGREATRLEIERLAERLLHELDEVTIVSEERHDFDGRVAASVHQVRIEVSTDGAPADPFARGSLERRVAELAEDWAHECVADRHADVAEL